jgi:hypothetical protein
MLGELGSPEKAYRIAHVAVRTVRLDLRDDRFNHARGGLPHRIVYVAALVDVNERIDIDGRLIDDGALLIAPRGSMKLREAWLRLSGFDRVTLSALYITAAAVISSCSRPALAGARSDSAVRRTCRLLRASRSTTLRYSAKRSKNLPPKMWDTESRRAACVP